MLRSSLFSLFIQTKSQRHNLLRSEPISKIEIIILINVVVIITTYRREPLLSEGIKFTLSYNFHRCTFCICLRLRVKKCFLLCFWLYKPIEMAFALRIIQLQCDECSWFSNHVALLRIQKFLSLRIQFSLCFLVKPILEPNYYCLPLIFMDLEILGLANHKRGSN